VALLTSELGCMFPTNDGVVEWVYNAFGNRFSFVINDVMSEENKEILVYINVLSIASMILLD